MAAVVESEADKEGCLQGVHLAGKQVLTTRQLGDVSLEVGICTHGVGHCNKQNPGALCRKPGDDVML